MRSWGFVENGFFTPPTESGGHHYPAMQFTGFKDMGGKEIYEGDILVYRKVTDTVRFTDKEGKHRKKKRTNPKEELHYWEVFMSPKGQWCIRRKIARVGDGGDQILSTEAQSHLYGAIENHAVAGNIYDNPDLIALRIKK